MHNGLRTPGDPISVVAAAVPETVASPVPVAQPQDAVRLGEAALGRWAATWLAGQDVLQICGNAGPARDIVEVAGSFTCVVTQRAVSEVVREEFADAVDVHCARPERLPLPSGAFGAVLCPLTVAAADPGPVLAELTRVLGQDPPGVLILTPSLIGRGEADQVKVEPLVDALRQQFEAVALLGQRDCFVAVLQAEGTPDGTGPPERVEVEVAVETEGARGGRRRIMVVASNAPLSFLRLPAALASPLDLAGWQEAAAAQAAATAAYRARQAAADPTGERDYLLEQLFLSEQTLALALDRANWWEVDGARAREEAAESRRRLDECLRELAAAQAQVVALQASTSWRVTVPLRQLKHVARLAQRA